MFKYSTSLARKSPARGRQLELFGQNLISQKPQISSIPGVSTKVRNRYRVTLAGEVLGDFLSLDEAMALAKGGAK